VACLPNFRPPFQTAVEHHHAAESLNRTILMFDYATYVIVLNMMNCSEKKFEEKFKSLKIKSPLAMWANSPK